MERKQIIMMVIGIVFFGFVAWKLIVLFGEWRVLNKENNNLSVRLHDLERENQQLKEDLAFYSVPHNLEKLFREKYNYKRVGETMIIIVPQQ